jgi:peptidyl-prolyl cis-trans isomerase B (cyclophilin B)
MFYRSRLHVAALVMCVAANAVFVSAQENKMLPPNQPSKGNAGIEAKKANARPSVSIAAAAKPEPFDAATVEKMAAQCVTLETGSGTIIAEMFPESAPETVRNFLNLAATGAFDTTTFSRVVKDFVVQGGNLSTRENYTTELARRAARTIPDEPGNVKHVRGILSMARTPKPNTATTNFFMLVSDAPHLDATFAAFGRVARGMEIVDAINHAAVEGEKPVKPVRLMRALVAPCAKDAKQTSETQP